MSDSLAVGKGWRRDNDDPVNGAYSCIVRIRICMWMLLYSVPTAIVLHCGDPTGDWEIIHGLPLIKLSVSHGFRNDNKSTNNGITSIYTEKLMLECRLCEF